MKVRNLKKYSVLLFLLIVGMTACGVSRPEVERQTGQETVTEKIADIPAGQTEFLDDIPAYSGEPYIAIHGNIPDFPAEDYRTESFESYSGLDELGRCGVAYANIGTDIMPTEERGNIGQVKPSGWQLVKYDIVDGKYLYNRCHLIAFQLAGENANEKNLITGTRYMNVSGMLPFENMVADYVRETENHVLYRVTPIFEGDNLVADGVQMEGWSVEDAGEGICFNVFVYNHQPGIGIDYATGESWIAGSDESLYASAGTARDNKPGEAVTQQDKQMVTYVLNINTKKFHLPECSSVGDMKPKNKRETSLSREEIINQGYQPCKLCNP